MVAIGFLIFGFVSTKSKLQKARRRQRVRRLSPLSKEKSQKRAALEGIYVKSGMKELGELKALLSDEGRLQEFLGEMTSPSEAPLSPEVLSGKDDPAAEAFVRHRIMFDPPFPGETILELLEAKLIRYKQHNLTVDPDLKALLDDFIRQLS